MSLGTRATINVRLAAVRRLAYEAVDNGFLSPDLAAGIRRVKGIKRLGTRVGNWLTVPEGQQLMQAIPQDTLRGKRDAAMMGLLLGCGLRRSELVSLTFSHIQRREERWVIVDLVGKAGHIRSILVPSWVKVAIDAWAGAACVSAGRLFRCVRKDGTVWGSGVTQNVVWYVVRGCAKRAGIQQLAPHDLRRSCARLCHAAGGELEQIQFLLGHASVQTTERYGCKQRFASAVNDCFNFVENAMWRPYFEDISSALCLRTAESYAQTHREGLVDMSPMPTPNSIYHMPWSPAEKKIARRAFDAALERQCAVILGDLKSMVASASAREDLWKMHDFLTEQRRQISQVYDYRYSMLTVVFARLLGEGWLKEADLEGLREDKLEHIRDMATGW